MDFDRLQKDVSELEKLSGGAAKGDPEALRKFASGLKNVLTLFLKDRKEPIRPGQIFRDAAAKNIVPGDIAARGDALIMRWSGSVTPQNPQTIQEDAARFKAVAEKVLPVLKAYKKKE